MCWTEWREKNLLNQHLAALGLSRKNNDKEAYVEEVLSSLELENCLENQTWLILIHLKLGISSELRLDDSISLAFFKDLVPSLINGFYYK